MHSGHAAYRGRFAPSPTGGLHLGLARTALLAYLRARSRAGAFVLRMEDIDTPRVVPGSAAAILEDLRFLGIEWDEGPDVGGAFGPYVQSDISIRGGNFGQTLVLVDGVRINDAQSGHHNTDLPLTLDDIERVEVLLGGGSSLFGADALAGTVRLGGHGGVGVLRIRRCESADPERSQATYGAPCTSSGCAQGHIKSQFRPSRAEALEPRAPAATRGRPSAESGRGWLEPGSTFRFPRAVLGP